MVQLQEMYIKTGMHWSWMGKHPLPSSAVHNATMELQRLYPIKSDLIASSKFIFVDKEHVQWRRTDHITLVRLLCPLSEKKDKILSAYNQIDTGNLLSNV